MAVSAVITLVSTITGLLVTSTLDTREKMREETVAHEREVDKHDIVALEAKIEAGRKLLEDISIQSRNQLIWIDEYWRDLREVAKARFSGARFVVAGKDVRLSEGRDAGLQTLKASFGAVLNGYDQLEKLRAAWIGPQTALELRMNWYFDKDDHSKDYGRIFSNNVSHPIRRVFFNQKQLYLWVVSEEGQQLRLVTPDTSDPSKLDEFVIIDNYAAAEAQVLGQRNQAFSQLKSLTDQINNLIDEKKGRLEKMRHK